MLTKDQVNQVNAAVEEIKRLLDDCEVSYDKDIVEENENVHIFTTVVNGYQYIGLVGWDIENKHVRYVAFDEDRIHRNNLEGFDEDSKENKIAWCPKDSEMFFHFLTGEVRDIMKKVVKEQVEELNRQNHNE